MNTLQINQNTVVNLTGNDSAGNAASLIIKSIAIDNHALAYAVEKDATDVWVVSRGPEGAFSLTVIGTSAGGVDVSASQTFSVVAGDAVTAVLTPSTPGGWNLTVPAIPAGW